MPYVVLTDDGETRIDADAGKVEGDFVAFYTIEVETVNEERVVKRGVWPFRRKETVSEEVQVEHRTWVMSMRTRLIKVIAPASADRSGEAGETREAGLDPEGESAVPCVDTADAQTLPGDPS
jgi:hypothetical protein